MAGGDDSVLPCAVNSRLWHPGAKSSRFPNRSQRAAEAKEATKGATTKSSPIVSAVCCRSSCGIPKCTRGAWQGCALFSANHRRGEIRDVDLVALEAQSADQQRSFLNTWKGCVLFDLVIVYLGLIGRSEPFRRLANEWATHATAKVDTLWADLDNHFPREILYPNTLAAEVDQRRFLRPHTALRPLPGSCLKRRSTPETRQA
jgi:hypothetical protein